MPADHRQAFSGVDVGAAKAMHKWTVIHTAFALSFIAYIPFSGSCTSSPPRELLHGDPEARGVLEPIKVLKMPNLRVGTLEEFTWKQIFDSDGLHRCGRCRTAARPIDRQALFAEKLSGPQDLLAGKRPGAVATGKSSFWRKGRPGEDHPKLKTLFQWLDKVDKVVTKICPRVRNRRKGLPARSLISTNSGLAPTAFCVWKTAPPHRTCSQDRRDAAVQGPHGADFAPNCS